MSTAQEQGDAEAPSTCPWCSASVPAGAANCPSCGASLRAAADGDILGVTQIDPHATSRALRTKPGRIATWLGAEPPLESPDLGGRIEPPSKEVREEMLRLELAAIDAEIEATSTRVVANRSLSGDAPPSVAEADPAGAPDRAQEPEPDDAAPEPEPS